jgi:hypothetical protein
MYCLTSGHEKVSKVADWCFVQTVDIPLDFTNYQMEAAKRVYSEKHPLGKEKEQLSRLRADMGRPEKGERLLEYTITNSSSLISSPASVVLRAGTSSSSGAVGAAAAGNAGTASAGAGALITGPPGTSRVPSATSSKPPPTATQPHLQRGLTLNSRAAASGVGGASPNVLKLSLRPTGTGIYPGRLVLTSPWDVRVVDLEIVAQCMGQTATLELECAARQSVSKLAGC